MTTPTPPPDQAATTPGIESDISLAYEWCNASKVIELPGKGYGWRHTCLRLAQEVERLRAQFAELLSIRHELDAANDWAKSQGMLLTQANAELLALRADKDASMPLIQFLAAIPIEAFGWGEKHRTRPITAWNGHELRVGHVLDARAALNSPTQKSPAK